MTDHTNATPDAGPEPMDDLELITNYLNGLLSPEAAAEVERRLEEDAAFREFAAPLFLVWEIPPYLERHPRPEGELEREWEKFVKRTGFGQRTQDAGAGSDPHGPRRSFWRRPWSRAFLSVALVLLGVVAVAVFAIVRPILSLDETLRMDVMPTGAYAEVPYDTGWIRIGDSIFVQPERGASLMLDTLGEREATTIILRGSARFRVAAFRASAPEPRGRALEIYTRAGYVYAGESELTVVAQGDTTDVVVHPAEGEAKLGELRVSAVSDPGGWQFPRQRQFYAFDIDPRERTRIVRNVVPALFRDRTP